MSGEQIEHDLGQLLQYLDGTVAKKKPAKQLQDPLLLLVAEATHLQLVVAL